MFFAFYTRIEFYLREMNSSQTMSHKSFEILKSQYNFLASLIINLYSLNERAKHQVHCKSNLKIVVE